MTKRRKMYADKCRDKMIRRMRAINDVMNGMDVSAVAKRYALYDNMINDELRAWYIPKKVSLFDRLLDRLFNK